MSDGRLPLYQLIEPSAIPGIHVDVAEIQDAAQLLDQSAQSIRENGALVETEWDALAGVYDAPEAPELFMIVKGNRGVGPVSRDLAVDYSKAASALSTLSYALSAPIKTLKDLHEQALDFRNSVQGGVVEVPTTSGTSGQTSMKEVGWADDISTKARNTQLIQAVNAAYVQLDEAKAEAINAINAIEPSTSTLFSTGPGYVPASLDDLNAPGAELPYGMPRTADSCSTENISNTGTQWFSDSVNGLTSLVGYDIYTGEGSWATAGATWSAVGMTAAGAVLFATPAGWAVQSALSNVKAGGELPAPLKAVDDFVNGAGDQAAAAVAGFTQWDTWAKDPGAAATNVVLNVGSLFIPVGGAGAGIKALTTSAKVGVIIEKVAGAATHIPGAVGPALSTGIRLGAAGALDALKGLQTVLDAPGVLAVEAVKVVKSHLPVFEPSLAGVDNSITHLANEATTMTPSPSGGGGGGGHVGDTSSSSPGTGYDPRNYNADGTIKEPAYGEISPERRDELLEQQAAHAARLHEHDGSDSDQSAAKADPHQPHESQENADAGQTAGSEKAADSNSPDSAVGESVDGRVVPGWGSESSNPVPATEKTIVVEGKDLPRPREAFAARTGLEPNTRYDVAGRGRFYTDDTGRVTHVETEYGERKTPNADLNKPQPNVTYDVTASSGNHHVFVTDDLARTASVQVEDLTLGDAFRSGWIQSRIGKLGGFRFEGSHLVSNATAGGRESINIIAMLQDVNRGSGSSFGNLEAMLRGAIRGSDGAPPAQVSLEIYPHYPPGGGKVPDSIGVEYSINDGRIIKKVFPNA